MYRRDEWYEDMYGETRADLRYSPYLDEDEPEVVEPTYALVDCTMIVHCKATHRLTAYAGWDSDILISYADYGKAGWGELLGIALAFTDSEDDYDEIRLFNW